MITVKTTSGQIQVGTFLPEKQTGAWAISEAAIAWPDGDWVYAADAMTGRRFAADEMIPDGTTVHVLSEQPVDA